MLRAAAAVGGAAAAAAVERVRQRERGRPCWFDHNDMAEDIFSKSNKMPKLCKILKIFDQKKREGECVG